jgi:hypothetical protein
MGHEQRKAVLVIDDVVSEHVEVTGAAFEKIAILPNVAAPHPAGGGHVVQAVPANYRVVFLDEFVFTVPGVIHKDDFAFLFEDAPAFGLRPASE